MSLPIDIRDVLHARCVEWERLEFKTGWNPEAVLHTLCAFANDFHNLGGGYVVIGVAEEDGRPFLASVGLAGAAGACGRPRGELGSAATEAPPQSVALTASAGEL